MINISPELKTYIENHYRGFKGLSTPDELLNIQGTKLNIVLKICDEINSPKKKAPLFKLLKECMDLGVNLNKTKEYPEPLVFRAASYPPLALFMLENGAYNEGFKEYNQKHKNFLLFFLGLHTDIWHMDHKLKIMDIIDKNEDFNPNKVHPQGYTLLQIAQQTQCMQWLLDKGCDPHKKNYDGENAFQFHEKCGNTSMVAVLKKHMAEQECLKIISMINQKHNLQIEQPDHPTELLPKSKMVL